MSTGIYIEEMLQTTISLNVGQSFPNYTII